MTVFQSKLVWCGRALDGWPYFFIFHNFHILLLEPWKFRNKSLYIFIFCCSKQGNIIPPALNRWTILIKSSPCIRRDGHKNVRNDPPFSSAIVLLFIKGEYLCVIVKIFIIVRPVALQPFVRLTKKFGVWYNALSEVLVCETSTYSTRYSI